MCENFSFEILMKPIRMTSVAFSYNTKIVEKFMGNNETTSGRKGYTI